MICKNNFGRVLCVKDQPKQIKLIFIYRYISLIITTFFYFINFPNQYIGKKIFVVTCISVSSMILNYLYIKSQNISSKIMILVLVETICNSFILIPTGGLNSPYVWYFINTVLIIAIKLDRIYCWLNLFIYLSVSILSEYIIFYKSSRDLLELMNKQSNLILSLILVTAVIQQLSKYIKEIQNESIKLMESNNQLQFANAKIKESINYITKLYQTIHVFISQRDSKNLIDLIAHYTKIITNSDTVLYYIVSQDNNVVASNKDISRNLKEKFKSKILEQWEKIEDSKIPIETTIENERFLLVSVKSTYKFYGILAIEVKTAKQDINYKENIDQLSFLAEISSIIIERAELEEINNRLIITEEQNRIAEEIHDSVLQRLFSVSCGLFTFKKAWKKLSEEEMDIELNVMRNSVEKAMKELREIIYGLSWKKGGVNTFEVDLKNYIEEIKKLNSVNISLNFKGRQECLLPWQKKALYRIICEGIGNSVRHGKASYISITLNIQDNKNLLEIVDNGIGFNTHDKKDDEQNGLGIRNLYCLAYCLKGKLFIDSQEGMGTKIQVIFPNNSEDEREGEAV